MKIFTLSESLYHPGKYAINFNLEAFKCYYTKGSYNVMMARVMGLNYASYLRMCRDLFGAEIHGKNSYYPVAYFSSKLSAKPLLDNLNARAELILFNYRNPEYEKHAQVVKEFDERKASYDF